MSLATINRYFRFARVKIIGQFMNEDHATAIIKMAPDLRYIPICGQCGKPFYSLHSYTARDIRDLNLTDRKVFIHARYRKGVCVWCCKICVEAQDYVYPGKRLTKRLARYVAELCKHMTVKEVAEHLGLDWKTVKELDKQALEEEFGETDYRGLRMLAIDEIAVRRGHKYLTVVLDYETGRIVWVGEGRDEEALNKFFQGMTDEERWQIEAVAMDMWPAYINSVRHYCPNAKIVYDLFHVVKDFNRVIDKIRNEEYRKAKEGGKEVIKGSKYLLLKNHESLNSEERVRLRDLIKLNENLALVHILKDDLKKIWDYRYRTWAVRGLEDWCIIAYDSGLPDLIAFADKLERHKDGILNHCDYPINSSKLEGINNTIKVIKRRAYGFHDTNYFILKIKQAFPGKNNQLNWR